MNLALEWIIIIIKVHLKFLKGHQCIKSLWHCLYEHISCHIIFASFDRFVCVYFAGTKSRRKWICTVKILIFRFSVTWD